MTLESGGGWQVGGGRAGWRSGWGEGSGILETQEFGRQYMDIARSYADRLHALP